MGMKKATEYRRIGILMGGPSSEREISLKSGKAVFDVFTDLGLDVVAIDIKTDKVKENVELIKSKKIDCAFIALHGRFGEDGQIQEILDKLNIPYTGSGVRASKLAMDKIASRRIFEDNKLSVPRYHVLEKESYHKAAISVDGLKMPWVVKPASHGSSIGLSIIDKHEDSGAAIDAAFSFDERIIIEEYIPGRELTVGILEERALSVIEIVPKHTFFDYEAKYKSGLTDYIIPAPLDEDTRDKVKKAALSAHRLLGCFGFSRVDIILSHDNLPFVLEVNTIPGLTSTSLLPKAARLEGVEFGELCLKMIKLAHHNHHRR